jgi:phosphatidylinositol/phosphatidylcholine transfer protein
MSSAKGDKQEILKEFRRQVEEEGIIHEGDTVGTNDDTLLWLFFPLYDAGCG